MKWKKYAIATTASAEDAVVAVLNELGISAVEISDSKPVLEATPEDCYYEELQPDLPDTDEAAVIFYLDEDADDTALLSDIRAGLEEARAYADIGEGSIMVSLTDEADWRDKWKEYFHSFMIGDILIRPSWEDREKAIRTAKNIAEALPAEKAADTLSDLRCEIVIDPGVSFGTGQHETTRMCIEALSEHVTPETNVLDIGCGSGILSVAALKLGARSVAGTDIDEACMDSVRRNFAMNGLGTEDLKFYIGDLTKDTALQEQVGEGRYEVVVANILADIILGMLPQMVRAMRADGVLILSGIIDFKEEAVLAALSSEGFSQMKIRHAGEWVCITARR